MSFVRRATPLTGCVMILPLSLLSHTRTLYPEGLTASKKSSLPRSPAMTFPPEFTTRSLRSPACGISIKNRCRPEPTSTLPLLLCTISSDTCPPLLSRSVSLPYPTNLVTLPPTLRVRRTFIPRPSVQKATSRSTLTALITACCKKPGTSDFCAPGVRSCDGTGIAIPASGVLASARRAGASAIMLRRDRSNSSPADMDSEAAPPPFPPRGTRGRTPYPRRGHLAPARTCGPGSPAELGPSGSPAGTYASTAAPIRVATTRMAPAWE
mmetsp:Transcript_20396/g.51498  ORF Transcript_20396/g.51498 Transcript_20396/m.51498 type:complete len:267 (-) Transcript_20396:61-861(-)